MSERSNDYPLFHNAEAVPVEPRRSGSETRRFSDFVVYVDESGDHSLTSIDEGYPVFVLALCVFHKRHYSERIIPAIEKLKFNYFGHDSVVLHETDIRKQRGIFAILSHKPRQDEFMTSLSGIMSQSNFNSNSNFAAYAMAATDAAGHCRSRSYLPTRRPIWQGFSLPI